MTGADSGAASAGSRSRVRAERLQTVASTFSRTGYRHPAASSSSAAAQTPIERDAMTSPPTGAGSRAPADPVARQPAVWHVSALQGENSREFTLRSDFLKFFVSGALAFSQMGRNNQFTAQAEPSAAFLMRSPGDEQQKLSCSPPDLRHTVC